MFSFIFSSFFTYIFVNRKKQLSEIKMLLQQNNNLRVFLLTIRYSEGTLGQNGYRTMFTGKLFNNYLYHPNISNCVGTLCSTAAGAYQFLYSTWKQIRDNLGLQDFSPENQDIAAIELIRSKDALQDVETGNFDSAIKKLSVIWASFPYSPYGQPTKTLAQLQDFYLFNGGLFA